MRFGKMFVVAGLTLCASASFALDVNPVESGIGEESLAPAPVAPRVSAGPAMASPTVAASSSVPVAADVFSVKGIVVTLSDTSGFDRDAALEKGARASLPTVLTSLGLKPEEAEKKVKSLGSAMRFVKGYKVVKESLIPSYSLTADISFNEAMIRKNFGGLAKPQVAAPANVGLEGEVDLSTPIDEVVEDTRPIKQWIVRITDSNPASVDKVRANLNRQASTKAVYRLLTSEGAELLVDTPLDAAQVKNSAGMDVQVIDMAAVAPAVSATVVPGVPVRAETVPAANPAASWQGTDEQPVEAQEPARPMMPWSRY